MAGRSITRGGHNVMGEGRFITGCNITREVVILLGCFEGCRIITFVMLGVPYVHPEAKLPSCDFEPVQPVKKFVTFRNVTKQFYAWAWPL